MFLTLLRQQVYVLENLFGQLRSTIAETSARSPMISRRQLLQSTAVAAGLVAAGPAAAKAGPKPASPQQVNGFPVPRSWRAVPFALDEVDLQPSVFTEKRDRILAYARAYPADRILANFRAAAG